MRSRRWECQVDVRAVMIKMKISCCLRAHHTLPPHLCKPSLGGSPALATDPHPPTATLLRNNWEFLSKNRNKKAPTGEWQLFRQHFLLPRNFIIQENPPHDNDPPQPQLLLEIYENSFSILLCVFLLLVLFLGCVYLSLGIVRKNKSGVRHSQNVPESEDEKKFLIDCSFLPEILIIWKQQRELHGGGKHLYNLFNCIVYISWINLQWQMALFCSRVHVGCAAAVGRIERVEKRINYTFN